MSGPGLRALLTVRGPQTLPEDFHLAMDRLLQAERRMRPEVDPLRLPRLGDVPGTAAAHCAVWQGDITPLAAAGPRLREDCAHIMRAQGTPEPTGHAKATRAYNLPARYVLHTVGPIVRGTLRPEHEEALAACYRACLGEAYSAALQRGALDEHA